MSGCFSGFAIFGMTFSFFPFLRKQPCRVLLSDFHQLSALIAAYMAFLYSLRLHVFGLLQYEQLRLSHRLFYHFPQLVQVLLRFYGMFILSGVSRRITHDKNQAPQISYKIIFSFVFSFI